MIAPLTSKKITKNEVAFFMLHLFSSVTSSIFFNFQKFDISSLVS